ncbi:MAG TPA: M20/M25/M40 family metallo-hydrolase [Pyrinomonadaceae bacterium]|nr:M20/M25/M40 family metallo-hydrolase [Pyrinomonadaceae bacterium]
MTARRATLALTLSTVLLLPLVLFAQTTAPAPSTPPQTTTPATPAPDTTRRTPPALAADVERIREEGLKRSQVLATIRHLTEVIGPRLTGSPAARRANEWTRDRLTSWGLQNARLEEWGPFGRAWTLEHFSAEVVGPSGFPLHAYPKAWSPSTPGPLTAEVINVAADDEQELERYKGRLRGAFVLVGAVRQQPADFTRPRATRFTDEQLARLEAAPDPSTLPPRAARILTAEQRNALEFAARKLRFYHDEGAALLIDSSRSGDGGMLQFVQSAAVPQSTAAGAQRVASWEKDAPKIVPQISVSNDHYNRMVRMIEAGERVRATVNIDAQMTDDARAFNTIAEIPGTDLKDEVVMLGAHLDSWHTATGATDNAAGVGMMMEAVRIIRASGLSPRRTIRIALWTGEEQGLLGSEAYVREHFGPVVAAGASPSFKPAAANLSAYFNADSGTGRVRGLYAQGNPAARDLFRRWLDPVRDLGATVATLSNSSGSDFLAFDQVGLNGFDFLQDEIEYEVRTWHSNEDTFDRVIEEDMKQGATVVATIVYSAAMSDEKIPRKARR